MTTLITGSSGKLGSELIKLYPNAYAPTRKDLDITKETQVSNCIRKIRPSIIIHAAAVTNVEECEVNQNKAYLTNINGTQLLAKCAKDAFFVYVSSACVFKGDEGNYTENDGPNPVNFYGLTKYLAELSVTACCQNWLIIRTNFVKRAKWPYPKAFVDRYGTYLYADQVAFAIKELVEKNFRGIVHVCGEKKMSMYTLAYMLTPNVQPITLSEYKGKAKLTRDMSLQSIRIPPYKLEI